MTLLSGSFFVSLKCKNFIINSNLRCVTIELKLELRNHHLVFQYCLNKKATTNIDGSNELTSDYTRNKTNNRLLLKPFGYKVMTIYIAYGYCFQT